MPSCGARSRRGRAPETLRRAAHQRSSGTSASPRPCTKSVGTACGASRRRCTMAASRGRKAPTCRRRAPNSASAGSDARAWGCRPCASGGTAGGRQVPRANGGRQHCGPGTPCSCAAGKCTSRPPRLPLCVAGMRAPRPTQLGQQPPQAARGRPAQVRQPARGQSGATARGRRGRADGRARTRMQKAGCSSGWLPASSARSSAAAVAPCEKPAPRAPVGVLTLS